MAFISLKDFLGRLNLATAEQFDTWNKAWRVAAESGSQLIEAQVDVDSLLAYREQLPVLRDMHSEYFAGP